MGFIIRLLDKIFVYKVPIKRSIFFTSDLHLDHKNIIKYCRRPFRNVKQMNRILVRNWNRTIKKRDIVYFLGDLAFGRGSKNTDYWYRRLNGMKIFIKGNHDVSKNIKFYQKYIFTYKKRKFLLVHTPSNVPKTWEGWVIHGHVHNKYQKNCPLINNKTKRINVSVEMTKYRPIRLEKLMKLIK